MHGFAGYFDTVLYGNVVLSIHPQTYSTGMFSWFPIYFPIKVGALVACTGRLVDWLWQEPMYVAKGDKIEIHIWRKVLPSKVK